MGRLSAITLVSVIIASTVLLGCVETTPTVISELPRITIKKEKGESVAHIWIRPYFGDLIIYDLIELKINGTTVLELENVPSGYFEFPVTYNETYIINATVYYTEKDFGTQRTIVYQWSTSLEFKEDGIYVRNTYHGETYDSAFEEKD